ncbi:MAG: nicotinate-nucleotide adenylyltransferase [Eggerthellaceae bacterium]|nr:nicotinate-nucleotide adenylyltransferase [Eggerthellaceae bacterium]
MISERFDNLGSDGSHVRLGIMGGTFDPIHNGHLACAEQAREKFGLDAVIFIPTGIPSFKRDRHITPARERLEMCRLACLPNPHFDVSSIEVDREGITYAVDTLEELRAHYPDNVELFFITGADSIMSIARWRQSARIASLVTFIAATRPGYVITDEFRKKISELGNFSVEFIEITSLAISSRDLRKRVSEGYSCRYLTTLSVCEYIFTHGLYRNEDSHPLRTSAPLPDIKPDTDAGDPYSEEFLSKRHAELKDRVNPKRLAHSEGVAYTARLLAQAYGVDEDKAYLAGLLHDWDKGYDDEGIKARVNELCMSEEFDPWVVEEMPHVLHGATAAKALSLRFPQIPADVIQAISRHTLGATDMTDLDMVIYIADGLEPTRNDAHIEELRGLIGQISLEDLFFMIYQYWTLKVVERGRALYPGTPAVWNEYAARARARKGKKRDRKDH